MNFYILNNGLITDQEGYSGSDRRAHEWTKIFAEQGNKITLIIPQIGRPRYQRLKGKINIVTTSSFGDKGEKHYLVTYLWRALRACLLLSRTKGKAVIYSSSDLLADSLPAIYARLRNKKTKWVAGLHLVAPNPFRGFKKKRIVFPSLSGLYYFLYQRMVIFFMKHLAHLVLVSNEQDRAFLLKKGLSSKQVLVTYGAPNWDEVKRAKKDKEINYDACFLGRYHPQKGLDDLLQAWEVVCRKKPDARLIMLGAVLELKDKVEKMGLGKNIEFYGFVDGVKKYSLLKSSRICLFPSTHESFGLVACEALASGLPVVAYDLPIFRKIYPQGMVRVPIGDVEKFSLAILELLTDEKRRRRLSQEAESVAKRFNWGRTAQEILRSIEK